MEIKSYRDLLVWQKAMALMVACYKMTDKLPKTEVYTLSSEIRRSALHIPSFIADGQGRKNTGEYIQRLGTAYGSLMMLETQLQAVEMLQFLPNSEIEPLLEKSSEVGKMLNKLIERLRTGRPDS